MKFKNYIFENTIDDVYDNPIVDYLLDYHLCLSNSIDELSATAEVVPQVWGNITASSPEDKAKQAMEIYKKAKDLAMTVKKKFVNKLKVSAQFPNAKVLVDIKELESFVDKALNRYPKQGKGAADITDVLRSAILVNTQEEVEKTVEKIKKLFAVAKHKVKTPEQDPKYGYFGSHHFYVKIENMLAEIQIMTKKLWSYKKVAHNIYNKYRGIKDVDKSMEKMDIALSKSIFREANLEKKGKRKKGRPTLKKHKNWKFQKSKIEMY